MTSPRVILRAIMVLLGPRLRPDADVAGRRTTVAGALSSSLALALLGLTSVAASLNLALPFIGGRLDVLAMPLGGAIPFLLAPVAAGALVTAGVYFPWLVRRPAPWSQPARGALADDHFPEVLDVREPGSTLHKQRRSP